VNVCEIVRSIMDAKQALSVTIAVTSRKPPTKFPGIRVAWTPRFFATGYFENALIPDPPYNDDFTSPLLGRWTEWKLEAPYGECDLQPPAEPWWLSSWLRLESLYSNGPSTEIFLEQRSRVNALFSTTGDYREPRSLHDRFIDLYSLPQDHEAVFEFARRFGPLGDYEAVRDPSRTYLDIGFEYAERTADWFFAIRRLTAIDCLLELAIYEQPHVNIDENAENAAKCLLLCSFDLDVFGKDEPAPLRQWHSHPAVHPMRTLAEERNQTDRHDCFLTLAKHAFSLAMRKDAKHFSHCFDFPSEGGIKLEARTLLGAIYASLYNSFAESKNQVCMVCGKLFKARAGARTCSPRCRQALSRKLRSE